MKRALLLVAVSLSAAGCVEYNDSCTGLTENPDQVVGYLGQDVFIDKANARHANNAIGELVADAMLHAQTASSSPTQFAAINGGAIRAEGICVTRNIVPKGELTNGRLHEILLFNDIVEAIDVSKTELLKVVENGVAGLTPFGQPITSPPGNFLQVSEGAQITVDCSKPAGSRVTAFSLNGVDLLAQPDDYPVRAAFTDFNLQAGTGFDDLRTADQDAARDPAQATQFGGSYSDLAAHYAEDHYDTQSGPGLTAQPRVQWALDGSGNPTCATPGRPPPS
jgi:5'-nucleotidase/UDP-sugar diphosphatase